VSELHVVIGSGTVGSRVARLLAEHNKPVVVVTRQGAKASHSGIDSVAADATSLDSLKSVASSATAVYNCANPPYNKWEEEWPKLSKAVSGYAMSAGADLVICSNLYGYGPHEGVLTEDTPMRATWTNGIARAQVWEEAKSLHDAGKLRVTEVRGSDYLCASEQSRMGHRVIPNLLLGRPVQLLGSLDQPHTWTDPDDVARLMVTLASDERGWGSPWHVPSNEPRTQRQVVADIADELGVADYRLSAVGRPMEALLGLFSPLIRELNRGSYQFTRPFLMSSQAATNTFGLEATPWSQMISDLVWPYLNYSRTNGLESLKKIGNLRLPEHR
jgi:nucleoside-diphosphate-sugar epimerase